jgi:hypothetical protein
MSPSGPGGRVDAAEARRITSLSYAWRLPDGEPAPLSATEFDLGFIVLPILPPPPPQPPGQPPAMTAPGTAAVVVDKATGAATVVPYRGVEGTAELYRRMRTGEPRQ